MKSHAEVLRDRLAVYLGPNTARAALKTFAHKSAGIAPEALTPAQVLQTLEAMRPMLKTLLGVAKCDRIVAQLIVELGLH